MTDSERVDGPTAGWWGSFSIEEGKAAHWRIDSLRLLVLRAEREWQIAASWMDGEEREDWEVDLDGRMPEAPEEGLERHVFALSRGPLSLLPVVADRAVLASPRIPLYVPPHERAELFVGSPLWVRIGVEEPPKILTEVPIRRPSDTWFGPSTLEGELCYATRTRAVVDIANLTTLARRAITPVVIENRSQDSLRIDRLKLPVPYLSLHVAPDGQLWTPAVTMIGQEEAGMASFEVARHPPAGTETRPLSEARTQPESGLLIRAFSLFRALDSGN